jgi:hypothetical protein
MWKKFLTLLPVLLISGCSTVGTFTPLTADEQPRNDKNQYLVESSFESSQQSLLWDTVQGSLVVGGEVIPMTRVADIQNRWEGYVPVPATTNMVTYRVMFDYKYNAFGKGPVSDTKMSQPFTLKITD